MKILDQYAELKIQEKKVKEELKELQPQVIEIILKEKDEKFENELGKFFFRSSKTYDYTNEVLKLEEEAQPFIEKVEQAQEKANIYIDKIVDRKKQEEKEGLAKVVKENKSINFKAN